MRVVHLATCYGLNNTGGAAMASTRLHNALVAAGIDSHYVCVNQCEEGPNVHEIPLKGSFSRWFYTQRVRLTRGIWKFSSFRQSTSFNVVDLPGLERTLAYLKPDLVHVHWLNFDAVSLEQLGRLPYRTVFHLHDIWMLNGFQPYPGTDTRYVEGFTRTNSGFLERRLFSRKRRVIARLRPHFIGPSKWICRTCERSLVAAGCPVTYIPYVFDDCFRFIPELRKQTEKFIVLFGCYRGTQNPWKGWDDLMASVRLLPDEVRSQMEIHIFGEDASSRIEEGVPVLFHGNITDADSLIKLYHLATVFALPSKEDNSPLTKFEALFCGLPVLAFNRTGCAEAIESGVSGWIAPDGDHASYAAGLLHFFESWKGHSIDYSRLSGDVCASFSVSGIVERMMDLYQRMTKDSSSP